MRLLINMSRGRARATERIAPEPNSGTPGAVTVVVEPLTAAVAVPVKVRAGIAHWRE
jgi:hypothetical protein